MKKSYIPPTLKTEKVELGVFGCYGTNGGNPGNWGMNSFWHWFRKLMNW
ncbi:MAG: hypothetical protein JXR86_20680 [Spirochaetales bacterium]|nr:hypothetical protein [Spirochaetales bacterium]